jgi:HAD superfamily hydrolase (TIGR01490 family)
VKETIFSKEGTSGKKYFAFFDLDRTIINANSGKLLMQYAYKKGLVTKKDLLKAIWLSVIFRLNLMDTLKIIDKMVSWLKGGSETAINELSQEIFSNEIIHSVRNEISSEISFHKREGAGVVILSSAIFPICKQVADYLSMDDVICSNLEVYGGFYTGHVAGKLCFGSEKAIRLVDYCKSKGINARLAWYYGDAISDLQVLSSVGTAVCVSPDRKLKRIALRKGWRIIS